MERELTLPIRTALDKKIVLISGPRQVGKTTLARSIFPDAVYLNYDAREHRLRLRAKDWPRSAPLVVLDELHKMPKWKQWLKGIYDVEGGRPRLLVTGSARLDLARKVGDSLAGRYFQYRLHPLCLRELARMPPQSSATENFRRLMRFGGFPEPFLEAQEAFLLQWQSAHTDIILRQDLLDLESLRNITAMETLIELLRVRVGSLVSYESLARDLEHSPTTVKRWLQILENLYVIFSLQPYSAKIARSLRKARKYYFYDWSRVASGEGAKFENMVACALRKELDRRHDCAGQRGQLGFLRTKEGREIDFLVTLDQRAIFVETKWNDDQVSPHFRHFAGFFDQRRLTAWQVVADLKQPREIFRGPKVVGAAEWLERLPLDETAGGE